MEKVQLDTQSGCWNWTGALNANGYGRFAVDGKLRPAHRWIVEQTRGIPAVVDVEPDHLCRNRACVNPEHLELVTHRVNSQRAKYAVAECRKGHTLPPPNANGRRICRVCANDRNREYKARRAVRAQWDAVMGGQLR